MYLFVLTCDFNMELVQYSAARIEIINFIILRKVIFNKKQMYTLKYDILVKTVPDLDTRLHQKPICM